LKFAHLLDGLTVTPSDCFFVNKNKDREGSYLFIV